jgi:hypothetical protein
MKQFSVHTSGCFLVVEIKLLNDKEAIAADISVELPKKNMVADAPGKPAQQRVPEMIDLFFIWQQRL